MINFFKGILAGIGNIIPGLSGSALLVICDLYEKCLEAISNIFKNFKKSFMFLLPIGLGIAIGTFLFSNIIEHVMGKYLLPTCITFVGFMIGTLPKLFEEANKKGFKKSYLIPLIITLLFGIALLFVDSKEMIVELTMNTETFIKLILVGLLIASSTIIPGISSTVLLTMIGMYSTYLHAINTLDISILFPIFIGLAIGAFILSKLITYMLKNYYGYTFYAIIGFVIATIPALIMVPIKFNLELVISIICGIIAFVITINVEKLATKKEID